MPEDDWRLFRDALMAPGSCRDSRLPLDHKRTLGSLPFPHGALSVDGLSESPELESLSRLLPGPS